MINEKYNKKHCRSLIEHMRLGKSFAHWCAKNDIRLKTAQEWINIYPEFAAALELAEIKHMAVWEDILENTAKGELRGNLQAIVLYMKNRFSAPQFITEGWTDKVEHNHQGAIGVVNHAEFLKLLETGTKPEQPKLIATNDRELARSGVEMEQPLSNQRQERKPDYIQAEFSTTSA